MMKLFSLTLVLTASLTLACRNDLTGTSTCVAAIGEVYECVRL